MGSKNVQKEVSNCLQTIAESEFHLWHRRYGHISYKNLQKLKSEDISYSIVRVYQRNAHGDPHEGFNWYIQTFVARYL